MYKFRGIITALLGVLLLCLPPARFGCAVYAGIPIFAAAFFLRVCARMHIGEHTREKKLSCPSLAQTGPYRYIRHPLYLSNFMAGAAFALFHAGFSFGALGFCTVYGVFLAALAHKENKFFISCPTSNTVHIKQSVVKSIINDRYTWIWQAVVLVIIFLLKIEGVNF